MVSSDNSAPGGDDQAMENGMEEASASSPLIHRKDLVLAILIFSVCGYLYYLTTKFEQVADVLAQNIQPEFFPQLLIWTIVFLTLFIPIEHRFLKGGSASIDKSRSQRIKPLALLTGLLLITVVATILWVGTIASIVIVCIAMPILWGERSPKILVPYAIIFPILITLLFNQALGVHFEPGLFEILFEIH